MAKYNTVKVFAPATVSNVAVGFDILGFAIDGLGDDVLVRKGTTPGLVLKTIHKNKELTKDILSNTATYGAYKLLQSLGLEKEPIEMELYKHMDIGTGLGSSAASAVAGVFAVNEFLGRPYTKRELLPFAMASEQMADGSYHADNIAPCMLGGFIFIRDNESLDCHRLAVPTGLRAVIVHPKIEVLTKSSRAVLKDNIALSEHIRQSGNLGGFLLGMYKSDFDLIKRALEDLIIEKQRAHLIPHFTEIKSNAIRAGALGCSISGAGPSVFALCNNSLIAENIKKQWSDLLLEKNIEFDCFIADINHEGVQAY